MKSVLRIGPCLLLPSRNWPIVENGGKRGVVLAAAIATGEKLGPTVLALNPFPDF